MTTAPADDDVFTIDTDDMGPDPLDPGSSSATSSAPELSAVPGIPARGEPDEDPAPPTKEPVRNRIRTATTRKPRTPKARTVKAQPTAPARSAEEYGAEVTKTVRELAATLAVGATLMPTLALDAMALSLYAEPVGEAAGKVAAENPAVAKVLDRIIGVSAVGQLVSVVMALGVQLAANHGAIPAPMMAAGIALTPDKLLAGAEAAESGTEKGQGAP